MKREKFIMVRATEEEKQQVEKQAARYNLDSASYIRMLIKRDEK